VVDVKIFQVVPYYPPYIGGMELYVQTLSENLAARGHEVSVFTSSEAAFSLLERVNGVKIFRLRTLAKVYNVPMVPSLFGKLLHEEKPDILHAHQYPVFFSDVSAAASRFRREVLLLHVHVIPESKSAFSSFVSSMYYRTLGRLGFRAAHKVITPSSAYKTMLARIGVESEKILVIPYGIDLSRFHSRDGDAFKKRYGCEGSNVILSVGRLNYQKGFQYLLKAMTMVLQHIPEVKLVIVGDGEQITYLKDLSQSLGLGNSAIFTGAIPPIEIPEAYAAADVFVLPSIFESFGIALIEAQAAGKPVVSTRVGGAPETLQEDKTGFLVDPKDSEQLGKAIIHVLSDEKLAREMGENGKKFVGARFDIRHIVNKVTAVYEESITNNTHGRGG
jgi:glycosyltransferase involved in cell wall biosynthesis